MGVRCSDGNGNLVIQGRKYFIREYHKRGDTYYEATSETHGYVVFSGPGWERCVRACELHFVRHTPKPIRQSSSPEHKPLKFSGDISGPLGHQHLAEVYQFLSDDFTIGEFIGIDPYF